MMSEKAVSEMIGTIILIAIVFVGIGIVAVFMSSTPPPETKAKAVLSSSCIDCGEGKFAIVIRHEGGEAINPEGMEYFVTTEFPKGTEYEKNMRVNATKFYPAEVFSGFSRSDLCYNAFNESPNDPYNYNLSGNMKNGDVSVIAYKMKET